MRSVESEVVAKILQTLHELASTDSSKSVHTERREGESEEDDDDLAFLFLEEELKVRGIHELIQLPIGGEKAVIQFVNNLPADTLLFTVLQKLEFTECIPFPTFSGVNSQIKGLGRSSRRLTYTFPYLTGTGYQSLTDQSTYQDGVYDLGDLTYPSFIGFALPQKICCTRIGKIYDTCRVLRSTSHYASIRHQELKIPLLSSIGVKWQAEPKVGYNIGHTKAYGDIAFTFVREYRQFCLSINSSERMSLHPMFLDKLKEVTANQHSSKGESLQDPWEEFFRIYGTHVITSANGGGRIIITILENHLKTYFERNDLSQKEKLQEVELILSKVLDVDDTKEKNVFSNWESKGSAMEGKELLVSSIRLQGGDPSFSNMDLTTCHKPGEMKNIISKWSQTLPFLPIMLDTVITVEPITNILEKCGMSEEARLVDLATQRIYGKSFYRSMGKSEGRSWTWPLWSTNS